MASKPLAGVVHYLRAMLGRQPGEHSDGQLLDRFATHADGTAFATLMERHGGLVYQVCRRVLGDSSDVDDAFQATFLVLLRKAHTLDRQRSLGNWLYGVAYRVALKARAVGQRRRGRERQVDDMNVPVSVDEQPHAELRSVLDVELAKLPARYREPLVLCYLQGKTNEQAAQELGVPLGSMSKKLARGRELLRERLGHRGVAYTSAGLGTALASEASAAPPALLVEATRAALVGAAAGREASFSTAANLLAQGVLRNMFIDRIKLMSLAFMGLTLLAIGSTWAYQALETQAALFVPLPEPPSDKPPPRLPLRLASVMFDRQEKQPFLQLGVFPEEEYTKMVHSIPGPSPARIATLAGKFQRFQLSAPSAGQPISIFVMGPAMNSGELFMPVLLSREDSTITLVVESWTDNFGRTKNFVSRQGHLFELGKLDAGDYTLRVIVRGMFVDARALQLRYSQVREEQGSLSFTVSKTVPAKAREVPTLTDLKMLPREVKKEERARSYQPVANGSIFEIPGESQASDTISFGRGNFDFQDWRRAKDAGKLPPSLTKFADGDSVHAVVIGPTLNADEWLSLRSIEWVGNKARLHVDVWRADFPRKQNALHEQLVAVNLQLPRQDVNNVLTIPHGRYEVEVVYTNLLTDARGERYVLKSTSTISATFRVE